MAVFRRGKSDGPAAAVGVQEDGVDLGQGGTAPGPDSLAARRLQHGITTVSRWTVRLLIIGVGLVALFFVMGWLWSILLPILLGLLLATILWPPVRLMQKKLPNALAAFLAILGLIVVVGGLIAVLAPQVTSQAADLVDRATDGLKSLQDWVAGPPFNFGPDALGGLVDKGISELQANGQEVAGVVIGSLGAIGSAVVTFVLALVLCFFFLKDGPRFLPWLRTWIGAGTGEHIEVVSNRVWTALGQYVWSQAAVALVDAVFIGLGVWLLGVPFALPIAVLTFFGGFVPIVGAFVAGAIATLVALVSNGVWTAVAVLAIVLVVQQLEGNVMQPILVGRTLKIHAAVVLTSVALGGTLFGIIGAFLAVPAVAVFQVITRYVREQLEKPPATGPATEPLPAAEPQRPGTADTVLDDSR
jgi:predicted PurR-regulated permease PerM